MNISMKEYEREYKEPWKKLGLTEEQYRRPMYELTEEHRKVIFDILNVEYGLALKPQDFGIALKNKDKTFK